MKASTPRRASEASPFVDSSVVRFPATAAPRPLRVVLAYDDPAAGHRALHALAQRLGGSRAELNLQPSCWTFETLEDPAQNAVAAAEAELADLIICSTSGPANISAGVDRLISAVLGSTRRGDHEIVALFGAEEAWSISCADVRAKRASAAA